MDGQENCFYRISTLRMRSRLTAHLGVDPCCRGFSFIAVGVELRTLRPCQRKSVPPVVMPSHRFLSLKSKKVFENVLESVWDTGYSAVTKYIIL